jgi:hypothetical protein
MLGAIKGDVEDQASLFRTLSRRWRPLARLKGVSLPREGTEDQPARAWIGRKRPAPPVKEAVPVWNPWLWTK